MDPFVKVGIALIIVSIILILFGIAIGAYTNR